MANISSIIVNNFRSINKLEISNLNQFNLIIGKNNCGKTSLLEAIFFGAGIPKSITPLQLNSLRNTTSIDNNDISTAFHNLNFKEPIEFCFQVENKKRSIAISVENSNQMRQGVIESTRPLSNSSIYKIYIKRFDNKKYSIFYNQQDQIQNQSISSPIIDNIDYYNTDITYQTFFWTTDWNNYNYSNALGQLIVDKKKEYILKALQTIDRNIKDIQLGVNGIVFIDIGISSLLPINFLGQGIEKILGIITTLYTIHDGIFLIDEFENGLHHTSMSNLWRILFEICKEQNIQLFVTTHSYECIESYLNTTSNENISIFRIENDSQNNKRGVFISKEAAEEAIKQRWELR